MTAYGPTLPSTGSAGHGSYLGISCRHRDGALRLKMTRAVIHAAERVLLVLCCEFSHPSRCHTVRPRCVLTASWPSMARTRTNCSCVVGAVAMLLRILDPGPPRSLARLSLGVRISGRNTALRRMNVTGHVTSGYSRKVAYDIFTSCKSCCNGSSIP